MYLAGITDSPNTFCKYRKTPAYACLHCARLQLLHRLLQNLLLGSGCSTPHTFSFIHSLSMAHQILGPPNQPPPSPGQAGNKPDGKTALAARTTRDCRTVFWSLVLFHLRAEFRWAVCGPSQAAARNGAGSWGGASGPSQARRKGGMPTPRCSLVQEEPGSADRTILPRSGQAEPPDGG